MRPTPLTLLLVLCLFAGHIYASNTFVKREPDGTLSFSDFNPDAGQRQYRAFSKTRGTHTPTPSCRGMTPEKLIARRAKYETYFTEAAEKHGFNRHLIAAIARTESCFHDQAVSRAGARGLMQLMPSTASEFGLTDLFSPEKNVQIGVTYFAQLYEQFNQNTKLALAAYNAGPAAVLKYNGIPPYRETQNYVRRVLAKFDEYQRNSTDP